MSRHGAAKPRSARWGIVAALLGLLAGLGAYAGPAEDLAEADASLARAAQLVAEGRPDQAAPLAMAAAHARQARLGETNAKTLEAEVLVTEIALQQGRAGAALVGAERAWRLAQTGAIATGFDLDDIRQMRARALMANGQSQEAVAELSLVLQARLRRDEADDAALATMGLLVDALSGADRDDEAVALAQRALTLSRTHRGETSPQSVKAYVDYAAVLRARDAKHSLLLSAPVLQALQQAAERSLSAFGPADPRALVASEQYAGGLLHNRDFAGAEPVFADVCERLIERYDMSPRSLRCLANYAVVLSHMGGRSEAEALTAEVARVAALRLGSEHPFLAQVDTNLAALRLGLAGQEPLALEPARRGVAYWRLRRANGGTAGSQDQQQAQDAKSAAAAFRNLADADWAKAQQAPAQAEGLKNEAFEALQDAMVGPASRAITLMAARRTAATKGQGLSELVAQRQALTPKIAALDAAILRSFEGADQGERATLIEERAGRVRALARLDSRLARAFPSYSALTRPAATPLAAAQKMLAPDEAVLIVVPTDFGTHSLVVDRQGLTWARSALTRADIEARVRALRTQLSDGLEKPCDRPSPDRCAPFSRAIAHELYEATVGPVASALQGKRTLFVAPDGQLASLPFGVLVRAPPQGEDWDPRALRQTAWLADADFALVQIPSLQSLALLRGAAAVQRQDSGGESAFAGFGEPDLSGPQTPAAGASLARGAVLTDVFSSQVTPEGLALADLRQLRRLAPLPATGEELDMLREALNAPPDTVRVLRAATESAVKAANLRQVRVLAFATHGLLAGESRGVGEPGLVLSLPSNPSAEDDGLLTASEIAGLNLSAEWVILSACNTAGGDDAQSPGLSGLARAFFFAGARSLLASHWPVRDDVAPRLSVDSLRFQALHPEWSRAQALQAAMREVRDTPGDPSLAHPAAWAPFVLVGEVR